MALTDDGGMNTTMLVSPNGSNGGFGGMDGNGWWIILLLLLVAGGWNNGGFGGNNGFVPYAMNANTGNEVQRGFDQAAVMSGLGDINNGIFGIQNSLCNGFAGVNQAIANGFSSAEIAENSRQMANMNQMFGIQSALQNCCCENRANIADLKYTVATENCADRAALSDGVRSIIESNTASTQRILDQLCADKIDAKNERIADLERQLTMANLAASQTAQTSRILADNAAQTVALEQYLNPVPVPAYVVANPNCCNNTGCGCGA